MDIMERLIDKAMILAFAACCASLVGNPSVAGIALLLVCITCSALSEVLPSRLAAAAILACGVILVVAPEAAAFESLILYDAARLGSRGALGVRSAPGLHDAPIERRSTGASMGSTVAVPTIALALAAASLYRLGATGKQGVVVALTTCLFGMALLLSLRTSGLLAHRRSVLDTRDALAVRTRTLRARNKTLAQQLSEVQEGSAQAAADKRSCFPQLTQREFEIVALVSEGLDNREIAARAYMSEGTVRNTISSALAKLQLKNRTQLAVVYLKAGTNA